MTDRQTNVTDIITCPNKIRAHMFINVPVGVAQHIPVFDLHPYSYAY